MSPAPGGGAFYDLLPPDRRIGIDALPLREGVRRAGFPGWRAPEDGRRYQPLLASLSEARAIWRGEKRRFLRWLHSWTRATRASMETAGARSRTQ